MEENDPCSGCGEIPPCEICEVCSYPECECECELVE